MTRQHVSKVLHLILFRKWFEAMVRGEKDEEYREIKPYWTRRLFEDAEGRVPRAFTEVTFRNGYNPGAPYMRRPWLGVEVKEWQGRSVYAIKLGPVLEVQNFQPEDARRAAAREKSNRRVERFARRHPARRADQLRRAAKTYKGSLAILEVQDIRKAAADEVARKATRGYDGTLKPGHF